MNTNQRFIKVVITNQSTGEKPTAGVIDKVLNIYRTTRKQNHFMYKFQGFGISEKILNYLKGGDIDRVEITYHKDDCSTSKFECKLSQFTDSLLVHEDKEDVQRFVPVSEMEKTL